ncbi:MAG: TonB-dependent receptor [Ginsengibacter sp.]
MISRIIYTIIVLFFLAPATAQVNTKDSTFNKILDEVVVTGTRTENKMSNVPLPIQVITSKAIQSSGSQKLIDILQMQTGLVIANNPLGTALQGYPNPFGDGIQMQGLDPAYTLILVDGEPLTGRNAGIVNLGRIAVGNIKQVEILKGPATSLYGSDALAGVINIITQEPLEDELNTQVHYGTNNTWGTTISSNVKRNKTAIQLFANRFSSDGYDLDKNIYGKTVDPFIDYSINAKVIYQPDNKNKFILSGRYFRDNQTNNYQIFTEQLPEAVGGHTIETDKSIYGRWEHTLNNSINYFASLYATGYSNNAAVSLTKNDSLYEEIKIDQFLLKPELQVNIGSNPKSLFVMGTGYNFETVNSGRYGDEKKIDSWYVFGQKQFNYKQTNLILGARFDKNSLYAAQLSPKIAIAQKIGSALILKGSIGSGFKAPDFRQQFLNFSNSLIGYTLIGASELGTGLQSLQKSGQLDSKININSYSNGVVLSPEKSIGVNLGFDLTVNANTVIKFNLFRNDISNLIETYNLPFTKTNNQAIYSYKNLNAVYTEGLEANFSHSFNKNFAAFGGYQFLIAKDKEVVREIKEGKMYKRDPVTYVTKLVTADEYKGLYNRSRNTANLRLQYNNILYNGSAFITAKYRGKYGFSGLNGFTDGNAILDDDREFVKGFMLVNATFSKQINKNFEAQAGAENILNYTNKLQMPNLYGRTFFINVNYKFQKQKQL